MRAVWTTLIDVILLDSDYNHTSFVTFKEYAQVKKPEPKSRTLEMDGSSWSVTTVSDFKSILGTFI